MANQNDIFKSTLQILEKIEKLLLMFMQKYSGFFIKTSRGGGTLSRGGSGYGPLCVN